MYQEETDSEKDESDHEQMDYEEDEDSFSPVYEDGHLLTEVSEGPQSNQPAAPAQELSKMRQDKLWELDEEMKQKIIELHQTMTEQGMHGAADLLQDCFDPPPDETKERGSQVKTSKGKSIKKTDRRMVINRNDNSNAQIRLRQDKSEETIYEKAVRQRDSLSSEEPLLLSDDSINNDMNCFVDDMTATTSNAKRKDVDMIPEQ